MLSRIKGRFGSAHLIAVVALVMAVTGTSVALPGANSVDSGDLKKNAVTSGKIKNKTIAGGDVKANGLGGGQINEAKLGQVNSAKKATNVLWAVVNNPAGAANATLARSSTPAPTLAEAQGVQVIFNRDVAGCAWVPTRSNAGDNVETAGFAQARGFTGNPNSVEVRTRNDAGAVEDGNFHLVVVCPN
jgi:hypothetical protein